MRSRFQWHRPLKNKDTTKSVSSPSSSSYPPRDFSPCLHQTALATEKPQPPNQFHNERGRGGFVALESFLALQAFLLRKGQESAARPPVSMRACLLLLLLLLLSVVVVLLFCPLRGPFI